MIVRSIVPTAKAIPRVALVFAGLGLAGCRWDDGGAPLALKPIETRSRACSGEGSLYRVGVVLFCSMPDFRRPPAATYSVSGDSAARYAADIDDVVKVAARLTGTRLTKAADGRLRISITPSREPGRYASMTHLINHTIRWNGEGAARTGAIDVAVSNAADADVGAVLQKGTWAFLGLWAPAETAYADIISPETVLSSGALVAVPAGDRACTSGMALYRRALHGIFVCARREPPWPKTLSFAAIGDVKGYAPAVEKSAGFAADISGVRLRRDATPALILTFAAKNPSAETFRAMLQEAGVMPDDLVRDATRDEAVGGLKIRGAETIGGLTTIASDQKPLAIERDIQRAFLDPLGIALPSFMPPAACEE